MATRSRRKKRRGRGSGSGVYPKGKVSANHGKSIKCPNIYEALRRKGYSKRKAARISNEKWKGKGKCT